jgi:hypothetical protein
MRGQSEVFFCFCKLLIMNWLCCIRELVFDAKSWLLQGFGCRFGHRGIQIGDNFLGSGCFDSCGLRLRGLSHSRHVRSRSSAANPIH